LNAPSPDPSPLPGGIYVHIPFCQKKCLYCDFYSVSDPTLKSAFFQALIGEIRLIRDTSVSFDSIYIGGGTPSLFEPARISKLIDSLGKSFSIDADSEITLEINPGTVDAEKLKGYRNAGVNRLSIGIQTFQNHLLETLGRVHSEKASHDAVETAHGAGFKNIGLDLIFGIPGQSRSCWETDLKRAVSYRPEHLSCYMLTFEAGTPFERAVRSGRLVPPGEDRVADQMETAITFLTDRGYLHYEISNFSKSPHSISRHNSKYWNFSPYIGLGPSAHTFLPPDRRWNHADVRRYIEDIQAGKRPVSGRETLTRQLEMMEAVYLGLRTTAGIDIQRFNRLFAADFRKMFHDAIEIFSAGNMISTTERCCRLTRKGIIFHDGIVKQMVASIPDGS